MKNQKPHVSEGLIVYLEKTYPDRLPVAPPTAVEAARLVGQQDVIRKLRQLSRDSNTL